MSTVDKLVKSFSDKAGLVLGEVGLQRFGVSGNSGMGKFMQKSLLVDCTWHFQRTPGSLHI